MRYSESRMTPTHVTCLESYKSSRSHVRSSQVIDEVSYLGFQIDRVIIMPDIGTCIRERLNSAREEG